MIYLSFRRQFFKFLGKDRGCALVTFIRRLVNPIGPGFDALLDFPANGFSSGKFPFLDGNTFPQIVAFIFFFLDLWLGELV